MPDDEESDFIVDSKGMFWYIPPEERWPFVKEYLLSRGLPPRRDPWLDEPWPWNVHIEHYRTGQSISDAGMEAIQSILQGETQEEWAARWLDEGKSTSPIDEEKQD